MNNFQILIKKSVDNAIISGYDVFDELVNGKERIYERFKSDI